MRGRNRGRTIWLAAAALALLLAVPGWGETCSTVADMDPGTRQALEQAARLYFGYVAQGNTGALRQSAIASVAGNFGGIETAVKEHAGTFPAMQASVRGSFLLEALGQGTLARAEFLCGIFGPQGLTPESVVFVLNDLPAGRYAVVILEGKTKEGSKTVSFVLQQEPPMTGAWRLAGLYVTASRLGEHDGNWFWEQGRAYQAKGQAFNAWFYYGLARDLLRPLPFMTTAELVKFDDEQQRLLPPAGLPLKNPVEVMAEGGRTFKITQMFPVPDPNDAAAGLDLVADYQAADISDTQKAYLDNLAVIHALATKYPELLQGFAAIGARAVDPAGKSYGTLLQGKDLK
ncbi:MAG TPA: hypothetical protein VE825_16180 [Terriglobales bacterium]|jgi:hypothetical protein|nr:hypothetical protein [Terriglobales bacterium]